MYWALGLSIGVLAGIWLYVAPLVGIAAAWPCFVGWALFFAAGGDHKAIIKAGAPAISGILLAWLAVVLMSPLSFLGQFTLPIIIIPIAVIMTVLAYIPSLFSFVPAQFAAAASYFGVLSAAVVPAYTPAGAVIGVMIPIVCGVLLGWLSAMLPKWLVPGVMAPKKT
jgi:hypothetical protein